MFESVRAPFEPQGWFYPSGSPNGDRMVDNQPPSEEEVEARLAAKREELLDARRNRRVSAWIDRRRQKLVESGELVMNLERIRG